MNNNEKWQPIENIDLSRRKPEDWAIVYNVRLLTIPEDRGRLWSEYEWAYFFCNADYASLNHDFEKLAELEMRAMEIKRDLFMGASLGEREILKERYIETEYVRRRFSVV